MGYSIHCMSEQDKGPKILPGGTKLYDIAKERARRAKAASDKATRAHILDEIVFPEGADETLRESSIAEMLQEIRKEWNTTVKLSKKLQRAHPNDYLRTQALLLDRLYVELSVAEYGSTQQLINLKSPMIVKQLDEDPSTRLPVNPADFLVEITISRGMLKRAFRKIISLNDDEIIDRVLYERFGPGISDDE